MKIQLIYPVYIDGDSYCAEDINGNWHSGLIEGFYGQKKISESKPKRFTEYKRMTMKKIHENKFTGLGEIDIYSDRCLDGAETLSEAIEHLQDYANRLEKYNDPLYKISSCDVGVVGIQLQLKSNGKKVLGVNFRG